MATRFIDHLLDGDHASRPAASAVPQGTLYACTDHDLIYQSDGTSTWSTWADIGGGTAVPPDCKSSVITTDVTMNTPNTWTDSGLSLSLAAGTWLLQAVLTIRVTQTGTDTLAARFIESGGSSTVYSNSPMSVASNNGQEITIPLVARVTLGSTTTVKVQGIAVVRTAVIEADGNDASLTDNVVSWMTALSVTSA